MPLILALALAVLGGSLVGVFSRWFAHSPRTPGSPALDAARAAGEAIRPHRRLRVLLTTRLSRETASGLLLTLALSAAIVAGTVLGVLAYLIRSVAAVQHVDNSVALWAQRHRAAFSTAGLKWLTQLGNIQIVVALALILAVYELVRARNRWPALFLITVLGGMEILTLSVKDLAGRVRPTLNPIASTLGPSFPSGHSATAAAFWAAAALIIGRHVSRRARFALAGVAVGIAIGVAASRVMLDLHWFSDVIGGLALGWGWFALAAALFGGRMLRPTAGVSAVATAAAASSTPARRRP